MGYTMRSMIREFDSPEGYISYYEKHNCVFDFDKFKLFLQKRIKNLDLLLKVDNKQYPTNIKEMVEFLFYLHFTFVYMSSYYHHEQKTTDHPELLEYMLNRLNNHDYVLDDKQERTVIPGKSSNIKFKYVAEDPKMFAYAWLVDEVNVQLINIEYSDFLHECLVSSH